MTYAALHQTAPDLPVAPLLGPARPDGSFANPAPIVKEDNPVIATAFALRDLGPARFPGQFAVEPGPRHSPLAFDGGR